MSSSGVPGRSVQCHRCNAELAADARFCGGCGHAVSTTEQSAHAPGQGRPSTADVIGTEIGGRYRLLAKLGEGGMGAVYRAEQLSLKRKVALKLLKPELSEDPALVRRFNAEAELAAKLNHPNTVTLFDFGQEPDGTLFIAMEFIEGTSLREVMLREGPLPASRALAIAEQVAASLSDAHAHDIVHRDLKPDNVMLMQRGRQSDVVRVLDFGIAKLRDERGDVTAMPMTQAGDLLGTPQYMAPEQIRAERVDGRTDVYALGAMLYEMITGRLPFEAPTLMAILSKHLTELPVPPARRRPDMPIPAELDELVMHSLQKAPDQRPRSMDDVGERLEAIRARTAGVPQGLRAPPPRTVTPAPGAVMRPPGVPITSPPGRSPAPSPPPGGGTGPAPPPGQPPCTPAGAHPPHAPAGPIGTPARVASPGPPPPSSRAWLWATLAFLLVAGLGAGALFWFAGENRSAAMTSDDAEDADAERDPSPGPAPDQPPIPDEEPRDPAPTDPAPDWDLTPRRDIFGDGDQAPGASAPVTPPRAPATDREGWTHPSLGYSLELPPGFSRAPGSNSNLVTFSGTLRGRPAVIIVSGAELDTGAFTEQTLQQMARSLARASGGQLDEARWLEVGGERRFGGLYDVPSRSMRFQFVTYTGGNVAVIAVFGADASKFASTLDVRRRFFARGIAIPGD